MPEPYHAPFPLTGMAEPEERLRLTLEQAPAVLWTTDADLRVTSVTGGALAKMGVGPERFLGRTLFECFETDNPEFEAITAHRRALAGESVAYEGGYLGRFFRAHVEPLLEPDGRITGVVGVGFDITERQAAEEQLHRVYERYELVGLAINDAVWDHDVVTGRVWRNVGFQKVFGYEPDEVTETVEWWVDRIHPADRERVVAHLRAAATRADRLYETEYRFRRRDGSYALVLDRAYVLRDAAGRAVRAIGSIMDVTERRRAEAALREAQQIAQVGNWDWDVAANTVTWSDELYRIFGLSPQELPATFEAYLARVHPDDRAHVRQIIERARRDHGPFAVEHRACRPDGAVRALLCRGEVAVDPAGGVARVYAITQDITERKQVEEQLRKSQAKLRSLAAHQQEVREEERTRIAREIHDVLGQALTGLKLELAAAHERTARGEGGVAEKLLEMSALADQMIKTVRRLSSDLRPPVLDELGLPAAIEWLAQDVAKRSGIACRVRADLNSSVLPRRVATALFRIAQEALTNVARHAGATRVEVALRRAAGVLELEVADDGRGITEAEASDAEALGILGMRERALLLGGVVEIVGVPGQGTRLKAWIPVR